MCIRINLKERALVDSRLGDVFRPPCFDVLVQYHSYLIGRGQTSAAEQLLKKVVKGEKVISNMIEKAQEAKLI